MSIDIASWLADLGLSQYNEIFQAQGFDGQGLASLEDAELRELGITAMGHRKTILREAAKLVVNRETSAQFRQSHRRRRVAQKYPKASGAVQPCWA